MLQLTEAAASEIDSSRRAQGLPETSGLRIYGEPQSGGEMALAVGFAEVPAEDDQVSEREGARVFVAPEVAESVSSAELDITQTEQGPALVLTPQEPGGAF